MDLFKQRLFAAIGSHIGVELSAVDKKYAIATYNAIDKSLFYQYPVSQIIRVLAIIIGKKITDQRKTANFDLHDYQTRHLMEDGDNAPPTTRLVLGQDTGYIGEQPINQPTDQPINQPTDQPINQPTDQPTDRQTNQLHESYAISSFLGISSIDELKLLVNPESMYKHYYVVMDSDYRNTTQENPLAITQFTWGYSPTQNTGIGFCNSIGNVHNIVGMRMYQPRIPYLAAMNTSAKRVSILVKELSAQAFITETGSRFHFILRPEYTTATTSIELSTEDYNDGIFTFGKPITEFPSQTIVFGDPINPLVFSTPFDRFIIVIEYTCIADLTADY